MNCFSKKVSQENTDQWGRRLFNLPLLGGNRQVSGSPGQQEPL